jgi:G:T-mismatch repair DNA endonuclease (very short patch repair protein)
VCFVNSDILANVLSSWIHHGHTILQAECFPIARYVSALVLQKVSVHIQQFNVTSDDIMQNKENLVSFIHSCFFYEIHPEVPNCFPNIHVSQNGRPASVENPKACKQQQQPINSK